MALISNVARFISTLASRVSLGGSVQATAQYPGVLHYQDPEQIDLRAVLDTLVEQLAEWLATPRTRRTAPAA